MHRPIVTKSKSLIIIAAILFMASCGGSEGSTKQIKTSLPGENPGTFNPSGTAPTPGTSPAPAEDCTNTEAVTYSPKSIDFGLNQISSAEFNTRECQTVSVNPCFQIEANIDASSSTDLNPADATSTTPLQEFEQSSKPGQIEVCYNRVAEGKHTGKLSVRLNGSYTFLVPLSGQTLPRVFTLTKPATDPALVSGTPKVATPEQNVPYYEYFDVAVEGNIDVTKYADLLKDKKKNVTISVTNGGITSKLPYDEKGHFSGLIQIPNVGRTYPVTFTIETIKGKLTTTRQFITASTPAATLEIRDKDGAQVNVVPGDTTNDHHDTDNTLLVAGLKIGNLDVSAPNKEHALGATFKLKIFNSKEDNKPKTLVYRENISKPENSWVDEDSNTPEEIQFYATDYIKDYEQEVATYNTDNKKENDTDYLNAKCKKIEAFKTNTLCVPLPPTGLLGAGVNQIEATICNDITGTADADCKHQKTTIIVNNDLPKITIQLPFENYVYNTVDNPDKTSTNIKTQNDVILSGFVENYKPETKDSSGKLVDCGVYFWLNESDNEGNRLKHEDKLICLSAKAIDGNAIQTSYQTGNQGNVKVGTFSINLTKEFGDKLTRYTNLVQIRAENTQGHVAYKTVSFQIGLKNEGKYVQRKNQWDATSGQLGTKDSAGNSKRSPLMLNISQATLDDANLRQVVEKFLNDPKDGIKFADVVQGGKLPGDEDGNNVEDADEKIDFEKTLNLAAGETFWNFKVHNDDTKTADEKRKEWIWQNLHASMPQKARAITRYRTYLGIKGEASPGNLENVFFDGQCTEKDPTKLETGWNVACDSCKNRITTALVDYKTMKYVYAGISDINNLTKRRDWPTVLSDDNINNDVTQGKWKIGYIKLKNDGYIDADICIVGKGSVVNGCEDAEGNDKNEQEPAFWGHMAGISLIKGGITELENDPLLPLVWNVGKIRIKLKDALQIKKIKIANGDYTNELIVHKDKLIEGIYGSIQLDPYLGCATYYHKKYGANEKIPFGCAEKGEIYPVLIDRNSLSGEAAWADLGMEGKNPWLLALLRDKLLLTFKNMISCLIKEQVNPLINPEAFPYQPWTTDEDKLDLNIAVQKDTDGEGIVIKQLKDATNPILTVSPNIKDADVITSDTGVVVKLPFTLAANNIKSSIMDNKAWGHMYRNPSASLDANYPLNEVQDKPYLGISIGIEELLHSATSVIFKKGIQPLLDLFDTKKFDFPKGYSHTDWQLGLDSVILGNLEICNDLADKLLKTSLPASMTFSNFQTLFTNNAAHWDITIDPNSPPTLNMIDIPVDQSATANAQAASTTSKPTSSARLELGLTNIVISVSDFIKTAEDKEIYKIGEEFFKIRLDAIIKLNLDYYKDQRKLVIKIDPYNNIPAYVTVIDKGSAYDDAKVLVDLKDLLLKKAFNSLADGTMEVTFPANLSGFNTIGFGRDESDKVVEAQKAGGVVILDKTKLGENGPCDGITTPEYDESSSTRLSVNHDILINGYNQKPIAMQNMKDLLIPKNILSDIPRSLLQNNVNSANSTNTDTPVDMSDPCDVMPTVGEIGDNDIKDSLCDAGIKEISMGDADPNIIFDTENGYIHLSTKIMIEVYDWLNKQNNGEDI